MPLIQNPPSVPMLDSKPIAPPPYTMQSPQLPTPTIIPNGSTFNSPVQGQQRQYQPPYPSQSFQPQYPQTSASPQQEAIVQSPYQGISNMTPQQIQHVQNVIQHMPTEKLQMVEQQVQQQMISPYPQGVVISPQPMQSPPVQKPHFTTTAPQGLFGLKASSSSSHSSGPQDAQKSDTVKRFFGDTLFGRVARSSMQTASSISKMPKSLSPWGDNNPVTLPNVRYRDAVLFTTFAFVGGPLTEGIADSVTSTFGADSFVSEIINSGAGAIAASTVLKYGVFQIVEQAIDKGMLEHMLPEEEKMLQTTNVTSIQVTVKHKLMGVDADVRFVGVYPSLNTQACEKGWFAPYLFASARTPLIPRCNDFAIAQCFGPFLGGDYHLAHTLLTSTPHVLSLCDPNPATDIGTNRFLVLFTALSPFRGNMWSTSRRPGCATLIFHVFDGCPALVIPVTKDAPVSAWSPWTLGQMRGSLVGAAGSGGYWPEWQHEQVCEYLDSIISLPHVYPGVRERYVDVLGRSVSLVINGALALERCRALMGKVDEGRAGVCMFRY